MNDNLRSFLTFLKIAGITLVVAMFFVKQELNRLMDQCLVDGKREYECRAIVYNKSNVIYVEK